MSKSSSSRDFSRHISENLAKGNAVCPFGALEMGGPLVANVKSAQETIDDLGQDTIDVYDPNETDSDDEPISNLE